METRSWRLLPPKPDRNLPRKLEDARRYITTGHHRKVPAEQASRRQLRNYRLKGAWMTVTPTCTSTDYRLYLNRTARRLLFKTNIDPRDTSVPRTVNAEFDAADEVIRIRHHSHAGHPLVISGDAQTFNRSLNGELVEHGYVLTGRAIYYPVHRAAHGAVVDLSRRYTKAQAMKKEETERCERRASKSRRGS